MDVSSLKNILKLLELLPPPLLPERDFKTYPSLQAMQTFAAQETQIVRKLKRIGGKTPSAFTPWASARGGRARLPDGFWTMAPLRYTAKFDPFLSLDCTRVEGVGVQCKERKGSNFAIWQPWGRADPFVSDKYWLRYQSAAKWGRRRRERKRKERKVTEDVCSRGRLEQLLSDIVYCCFLLTILGTKGTKWHCVKTSLPDIVMYRLLWLHHW